MVYVHTSYVHWYFSRHKFIEKSLPFSVSVFEHGPRSPTFRSNPGPLETKSVELINACLHGNRDAVQSLLIGGDLSPDVADCSGFTPLQAAVVSNLHLGEPHLHHCQLPINISKLSVLHFIKLLSQSTLYIT